MRDLILDILDYVQWFLTSLVSKLSKILHFIITTLINFLSLCLVLYCICAPFLCFYLGYIGELHTALFCMLGILVSVFMLKEFV